VRPACRILRKLSPTEYVGASVIAQSDVPNEGIGRTGNLVRRWNRDSCFAQLNCPLEKLERAIDGQLGGYELRLGLTRGQAMRFVLMSGLLNKHTGSVDEQ
jgi:hypothetical protein